MSKITTDKNTKDLIDDVSSLFGCKADIVKDILEATLISSLLRYSQNDKVVKSITLPYMGTIGLRPNGESINNETNKIEYNFDVFVSLNDQFKELLKETSNNGSSKIAELYQDKIKKIASLAV